MEYNQTIKIIEAGRNALSQIEELVPGLVFKSKVGNDTDYDVYGLDDELYGELINDIGEQFVTVKWRPTFGHRNLAPKRRWSYDHTDNVSDAAGFINFITGIQASLGL